MSTEDPPFGDRDRPRLVNDDSPNSEEGGFELDFIKTSHPPRSPVEDRVHSDVSAEVTRAELVYAVDAALTRFGTTGGTVLSGDQLLLRHHRGAATENARLVLLRWDRLDTSERERVANQLARKLVASLKSTRPPSPARAPFTIDRGLLGLIVASCAILLALGYWSFWSDASAGKRLRARSLQSAAGATPSGLTPTSASGVCEATLARIFRGGLISMADADGWVVELALLGESDPASLDHVAALHTFIQPQGKGAFRYVWSEEPGLASSRESQPPVKVRSASFSVQDQSYHGLTLTFEGSFVESYFDEISREKFYHLAHGMSEALGAKHVALYARCAHDDVHTLGSWFLGADSQGVATSVLYFMGMFAAPRHLDAVHYRDRRTQELDLGRALSSILVATTHLDRKALSTLVGSEGGMAVGATNRVVVTFPFRDGNRATRVSRTMARVTGLSQESLDQKHPSP